eukprot:5684128-Alexandrium_andersonii.AAC.1
MHRVRQRALDSAERREEHCTAPRSARAPRGESREVHEDDVGDLQLRPSDGRAACGTQQRPRQ